MQLNSTFEGCADSIGYILRIGGIFHENIYCLGLCSYELKGCKYHIGTGDYEA